MVQRTCNTNTCPFSLSLTAAFFCAVSSRLSLTSFYELPVLFETEEMHYAVRYFRADRVYVMRLDGVFERVNVVEVLVHYLRHPLAHVPDAERVYKPVERDLLAFSISASRLAADFQRNV
jgi:hypothetical protein